MSTISFKKWVSGLILVPCLMLAGNTGTITGKVVDANQRISLVDANVRLLIDSVYTEFTAFTDSTGFFTFDSVYAGSYDLEISYMGFGTVRVEDIDVIEDTTTKLWVYLFQQSIQMNEVQVIAARLYSTDSDMCINGYSTYENLSNDPSADPPGWFEPWQHHLIQLMPVDDYNQYIYNLSSGFVIIQ